MVPRNAKYIRRLRSIAEEMVLLTPWLQEIWISVRFADDVRWERWDIVSAPGEKIRLRSPCAAETLHPQIYGGSHLFYGCANAEKLQLFWRDLWKTRKVTQNRYRTRCCVDWIVVGQMIKAAQPRWWFCGKDLLRSLRLSARSTKIPDDQLPHFRRSGSRFPLCTEFLRLQDFPCYFWTCVKEYILSGPMCR
jgi:hypothetical protein